LININLLPKGLKRLHEPGYWRVLAVAFPLLVAGVIVGIQFLTSQTITNLEREVQVREDQLALLQPFLAEQRDLQQRQQALRQLISIAEEVRRGRVVWTAEIAGLLELLPPRVDAETPTIDFRTLNMRSIYPATSDPNRFEGAAIVTEMAISGTVDGPETLARFVRALENARDFGVLFQNASRDGDSELFTYNLTVGGFTGGAR
jgi:type IV pilus assembly protein PilN